LPVKLIEQGRYEDTFKLENMFNEEIKGFEILENLEGYFSEYHDLIIKRAVASS
jgi:hypothetical protein